MLKVGEVKEIYEMKGTGRSIRCIAQELDVSHNTMPIIQSTSKDTVFVGGGLVSIINWRR